MAAGSNSSSSGYSPPIRVTLEIGSESLPVAEVAPSYLVLRSARAMGPANGTVVLNVDGRSTRYSVILPQGINPSIERQPLVDLTDTSFAEAV
jgi:hypothetical protein